MLHRNCRRGNGVETGAKYVELAVGTMGRSVGK